MVDKIDTPAIYGAMAKVFEGLKNVPKNGKMKHSGGEYSYLRADDVQEALNPLLVEHGVIVSSTYTAREVSRAFSPDKFAPYVNVELELVYHSVEDGTTFPPHGALRSTGEAKGTDDKSINKALTQAIKNLHRTTFQFASGEPDSDDAPPSSNDGQRVPSKSENTVAKARAKAPTTKTDPEIESLKAVVLNEFVNNPDSKWSKDEITAKWGEIAVSKNKAKASVEVYTALIEALRAE